MKEGQPLAYGSCALTKTQQNYAQIEKKTLAIVFECKKFHQYVYGRTGEVETKRLQETKEQFVPEAEISAISAKSYLPTSPEKYVQFQRQTTKEVELAKLSSVILKGLPTTEKTYFHLSRSTGRTETNLPV